MPSPQITTAEVGTGAGGIATQAPAGAALTGPARAGPTTIHKKRMKHKGQGIRANEQFFLWHKKLESYSFIPDTVFLDGKISVVPFWNAWEYIFHWTSAFPAGMSECDLRPKVLETNVSLVDLPRETRTRYDEKYPPGTQSRGRSRIPRSR